MVREIGHFAQRLDYEVQRDMGPLIRVSVIQNHFPKWLDMNRDGREVVLHREHNIEHAVSGNGFLDIPILITFRKQLEQACLAP